MSKGLGNVVNVNKSVAPRPIAGQTSGGVSLRLLDKSTRKVRWKVLTCFVNRPFDGKIKAVTVSSVPAIKKVKMAVEKTLIVVQETGWSVEVRFVR